jgi:transcription antitermination factor NusG
MNSGWSVAVTIPQQEARACFHLARQGFKFYLPRTQTKTKRVVPLFPRYIFVEIIERWYSLLGTFGVSYMLLKDEAPAIVDEHVITRLRAMERDGLVVLPAEDEHRFRIDQNVRIKSGHFSGLVGLYKGQTARQRETVLLSCLGRVELPIGMLDAA